MNYLFAKSSLDFGKYGDYTFESTGLRKLNSYEDVLFQNLFKLLKSENFDYELQPFYAANLKQFLGTGIDQSLVLAVENHVKNAIISRNIIPSQHLAIYSLVADNAIHLRIILFDNDSYTIKMQISPQGVQLN